MKSLLVLFSYHHHNTEHIANIFAKVLKAPIKTPQETDPEEFQEYDLIGFGSGIYGGKHYQSLLDLVDRLPYSTSKKAFLFSTDGAPRRFLVNPALLKEKLIKDHFLLRQKLQAKGYQIVGEFKCGGFNTNSFLKLFGGLNKGRPNAEDLTYAEEFAQNLKLNYDQGRFPIYSYF